MSVLFINDGFTKRVSESFLWILLLAATYTVHDVGSLDTNSLFSIL